jgi:hypothetical protein
MLCYKYFVFATLFNNIFNYVNFMFCADFDYSSAYKLTKRELVYYFHRLSKRGQYFGLYKEFLKELAEPYSILPLVRPSRSNPNNVLGMRKDALERADRLKDMAEILLQKPADSIPAGVQVMEKDQTTRASKDSITGANILGAPDTSQKDATLALLIQSGNHKNLTKKKKNVQSSSSALASMEIEGDSEDNETLLMRNTKNELIRISAIEGAPIAASHGKRKIVKSILATRAKKSDASKK